MSEYDSITCNLPTGIPSNERERAKRIYVKSFWSCGQPGSHGFSAAAVTSGRSTSRGRNYRKKVKRDFGVACDGQSSLPGVGGGVGENRIFLIPEKGCFGQPKYSAEIYVSSTSIVAVSVLENSHPNSSL